MVLSLARFCVFVAVAVGSSAVALGQSRIGTTGTSAFGGAFGTGGFGSSAFGGAGFGASRFGSSGFSQGGFGVGGFGNAGFGASRFGGSGLGGGFGAGGLGAGGFGNQSFGMGGYAGGQNFVGRDAGDMAAVANQLGRVGRQFVNQMNRNNRRNNRNRQPAQTIENPPQLMRVDLQVAFEAPRLAPTAVTTSLRTRLDKILADHNISQPTVTMEGDTAVLSGVAETASQRLVLEKLVALEPGVRQVRNEMTVSAPPAATQPAD